MQPKRQRAQDWHCQPNEAIRILSFRSDAKHRTTMCNCTSENLEIPGLVLAHHPGMTKSEIASRLPGNDGSLVLPLRLAFFDKGADAFLGVARHHVLGHHLGGMAIGL